MSRLRSTASGRYFGEIDLQFEYKGRRGDAFSLLQVDYESLAQIARDSGWSCELIGRTGGH